jgi:Protein of unknown function (DUF2934)
MASKSTLDPDNFPSASKRRRSRKGGDIGSLGPSDSSDTGSDLAGSRPNNEDISLDRGADEDSVSGHSNDIDTDRIISADEAGLGGGLDQAEEARLGIRDEEIASEVDSIIAQSDLGGSRYGGSQGRPDSDEDRRRRIAEAAYYRAQQRGFAPGHEHEDWIAAENDMDSAGKRR